MRFITVIFVGMIVAVTQSGHAQSDLSARKTTLTKSATIISDEPPAVMDGMMRDTLGDASTDLAAAPTWYLAR
jgi:hypothetical protein